MISLTISIASILFFVSYLAFSFFIYKKKEDRKFDIRNSFSYELFLVKTKDEFLVNILLFISMALVFANSVLNAVSNPIGSNIIISFLTLLVCGCFCAYSIIPLKKLKEHFVCVVLSFVGLSALAMLYLINDIRYYRIEYNVFLIISLVFDILVLLIGVLNLLNPRSTNLNLETDEDNNLIRPKLISLALGEWLIGFGVLLSQISIVVLSMI